MMKLVTDVDGTCLSMFLLVKSETFLEIIPSVLELFDLNFIICEF